MTAKEAYEKTLWNKLPEKIRKEIEKCVEHGYTETYFFRSNYPDLFKNKFNIVQILRDLGYFAKIKTINFQGEEDTKLEISWNL